MNAHGLEAHATRNLPVLNPTSNSGPQPTTRLERRLVLALLLVGLLVRIVPGHGLAVEHFDEGVYASNLLFPDHDYAYPSRHLYAPPLLPNLIEWCFMVAGDARWVPMLPGILCGSASVLLVWWLSRPWFGPAAAIAAATIIALNDYHIGLSRSALTDAPLMFFLLLAVGWMYRGLVSGDSTDDSRETLQQTWIAQTGAPHPHPVSPEYRGEGSNYYQQSSQAAPSQARQPRWGYCALGGITTGLAWITKYNGWLPLAIVASGSTAAWFLARSMKSRTTLPHLMGALGLMAAIATAIWFPVLNSLEPSGGYAAVAANHRQYVTGMSGWWSAVEQHVAVQKHWSGWLTLGSLWLAPVLAALVLRAERSTWNEQETLANAATPEDQANRSTWNDSKGPSGGPLELSKSIGWNIVALVSAVTAATVLNPVVVLVLWPLTDWIARWLEARQTPTSWQRWLGLWWCLAWIIGLGLATPFYRPYPRLLLPFCCIGWIGIGSAIVRLLTGSMAQNSLCSKRPHRRRLTVIVATMVTVLTISHAARQGVPSFRGRQGLADIAAQVLKTIREHNSDQKSASTESAGRIVYVYGEPALLHHLSADDVLLGPVTDLAFAAPQATKSPLPVFLVVGPHAFASETFDRQFKEVRKRLQPAGTFRYQPSDFVLLDDVAPEQLAQYRQQRVQLFLVRD